MNIRIDPAEHGVHLVDTENGMERIYVNYDDIPELIKTLKVVLLSKNVI